MARFFLFLLTVFNSLCICANVTAHDKLAMDIGGNLNIESKQDTDYAKGNNWGVNAGIGNTGSASGGFNVGSSNHGSAWVNDVTELRGGDVDINVGGKTTVTGAVVAAGEDGDLNLATNELEYKDLHDFNTNNERGFGVNTGIGISTDKGDFNLHPQGSTTVSATHTGSDTEQTTHATIGAGNITVGGDTNPELAGLNRDTDKVQEITKDEITGSLDSSVTVDNRIFSESGREQIAKQHEDFVDNVEQIGDGLRNNIVTKSIENAITDDTKNIIDTVGDYIEQDRQVTEMMQKRQDLVNALNGLTNYDSAEAREVLQQVADFVAGTDGFKGDLHLASVDGNVVGFAYQSTDGSVKNISLNLANIDMTDPNAVMNALYHETTNFEQHTKNEQTAKNRGDTGSGIFDLKNYGNENTNAMDNGQWLSNYGNTDTMQSGNLQLTGDIALNNAGYGTGNASIEDVAWTAADSLNYGGGLILRRKDENGNYKTLLGEEFSLAEMGLVLGTDAAFILVPVPGAGTATKVATKVGAGAVKEIAKETAKESIKVGVKKEITKDATKQAAEGITKQLAKDTTEKTVRTEARNLSEKLTLEEAKAGAGKKIMGKPGQLKDPKYNTLDKMQHTHKNPDGSTTTIHYDKNPQTGELSGFKFKDPTGTTTK